MDTQLSEHFVLSEMQVSATASRKGIPNVAPPEAVKALKLLCEEILEPVREHYGRPVVITSGYRSPRVNVAVGGSKTSQHCFGEAADFTVPGKSNIDVCRWIAANLTFDQLIYEFGERGWVHCSFSLGRARNQVLTATKANGRTKYLPGLVA